MQEIYNELIKKIDKGRILENEQMAKHTTFKVGGPADLFIKVKTIEELKYVIEEAKANNISFFIIGNGSNLLVRDNGIRGIVIKLEMNEVKIIENKIVAEAGALLSKVSIIARENNLSGLEFAYGIPGTVGGAVYMNAGAYGGEMRDIVESTTYLNENLEVKTINNEEHGFNYRKSIFETNKGIILNTTLSLKSNDAKKIEEKMQENLNSRKEKQPLEFANAGSTFKRGKNFITAKLIEDAGLKGKKIGGAMVSTKHSGFIVNTGTATAKDILGLAEYVKQTIKEKFDKQIELEIKILGE